jgi:hypothetical protein
VCGFNSVSDTVIPYIRLFPGTLDCHLRASASARRPAFRASSSFLVRALQPG